jgi:hypothetical protein
MDFPAESTFVLITRNHCNCSVLAGSRYAAQRPSLTMCERRRLVVSKRATSVLERVLISGSRVSNAGRFEAIRGNDFYLSLRGGRIDHQVTKPCIIPLFQFVHYEAGCLLCAFDNCSHLQMTNTEFSTSSASGATWALLYANVGDKHLHADESQQPRFKGSIRCVGLN